MYGCLFLRTDCLGCLCSFSNMENDAKVGDGFSTCDELTSEEPNQLLQLTDKLLASLFIVGMFGLIAMRRLSVPC